MPDLPPETRGFLLAHVPSVAHMEALVLALEAPGTTWDADTLAGRLYVPIDTAGRVLDDLARSGLLARAAEADGFVFAPRDEALRRNAVGACTVYRERLVAVTRFIHEQASPARHFSDAFRLRRDG